MGSRGQENIGGLKSFLMHYPHANKFRPTVDLSSGTIGNANARLEISV